MEQITVDEAYLAMYAYLDMLYDRTQSDDLGGFLGSMSLLEDGKPADSAVWAEWLRCVEKVKKGNVSASLKLG